jgi:hypothetical protein
MLISKIGRYFLVSSIIASSPMCAGDFFCGRNVLLEFKAAYFHPTGHRFKKIYGGGALYGPELTIQLFDNCRNWYAFFSVDWFCKRGESIELHTPTKIHLLPLAFGLKYFISSCCCECVDFYGALGFQPVRFHIQNFSSSVTPNKHKWVLGGIAKVGSYVYLPNNNFFLDVFIGYSFARASSHTTAVCCEGIVVPLSSSISGAIFGAGLGWRF